MTEMKTDGESDLKKFIEVLSDENYIEKINSSLSQTQKDDLKIVFERQLEANNVSEERKSGILESFNLGGAKMFNKWFDMQEVEEKGLEKGIQKIVFNMLELGVEESKICKIATISEEELKEYKELYLQQHQQINEIKEVVEDETQDFEMKLM